MHPVRLPGEIRQRPIWERIDRAARLMNPLLVLAAALLALVDLSVYSALEIARHCPPPRHEAAPPAAPGHPLGSPPTQG